jgi:phage-related minor tail protein
MAEEIGRAVIEVDADMAKFEAAMAKATTVAEGFERSGVTSAGKTAAAFSRIGDGAGSGLDGLDAKTKRVVTNLQREIAKIDLSKVGGAFEIFNADIKGANLDKIRPFVERLEQARESARALASEASQITFDKLLSDSAGAGNVTKNLKQLETALDSLGEKERALAEPRLFDARATEASKLNQAADYVQFWTQALDRMEAAEREATEVAVFERKRQEAIKLQQAGEYVQFWTAELNRMDAAEKAIAETRAFDARLTEAARLNQASEYVQFWTQSLDKMEAQEREAADAVSFERQRQEAIKLQKSAEYVNFWTAALDKAEAQEREMKANNSFITGLQNQANALGKTRADMLELEAAQRGLTAQAAPFIAQLRAAEAGLLGVGHATRDARVSATQLRAAYATLPAQITDVFTSLAGGQNPLLVLIQQGGQIKDSFGGVANTFRELGSALVKYVTPAKVAIAGIGAGLLALVYGYKQGAEESDEFVRSIVLTGNAAGLTVGQLQQMAKAISAAGGTQGKAAEVLTKFAASAKVGAAELQKVAQAAIGLERVGGPAVEDTAKAFESLAKDPAKAAAELNKQTNFLTASLYEQIKALEDQGRESDAAALAQSRFADVLASRKNELEANLGSIERGWLAVKDAIKGAADALLNVGRVETIGEQAETVRAAIAANARRKDREDSIGPSGRREGADTQLARLNKELEILSKASFREAERAGQVKIRNDAVQAGISLSQKQDALLDKEAKKNREIAAIRREARDSRLGDGPGFSAEKEAALIEAVNKKYTEKAKKGEDLAKTYGSLIAASLENERALTIESAGVEKLTQGEKRLLDLQAKIESGTVTYNQALYAQAAAQFAIEAAVEKSRQAEAERLKAMEKAADHSKKLIEQEEKYNDSLEKSAVSLLAQVQRLEIGEEAFIARENAQRRDEAAGLVWQTQMEGGNAILEERARLLLLTADLTDRQQSGKIDKMLRDQAQALSDSNRALQLEASLIGRSSDERALALAQLQIQLKLEREIAAIRAATPAGPKRDSQIADASKQADDALKQLTDGKNIDILNDLLDPSRVDAFGQSFVAAFDGANESIQRAGASLSDLAGIFKSYAADQERLNKGFKANRDEDGRVKSLETENRLIAQQGDLQIATYASMAGAAKGFFNEGTKGYKAMQAAETVFRAYQLASDLVKGVSAAAVAIANQAQGEPYSAFARMAAMAAAMASLGFATGFLGSNSIGEQAAAAQRQGGAATGRIVTPDQLDRNNANFRGGTVFGDDEARSESIARSIDILADNSDIGLDYSRSQLNALEAIRDSMAGVASLVVRSVGGGLTTGKNFGIKTGKLSVNEGDPILKAFGFDDSGVIQGLANSGSILGKIGMFAQGLWGKVTQKIADSGLEVSGTIADLLVRQFIDVEKTTSSFFGLKKDTDTETLFGDEKQTQELADQFGLIFDAIGNSIQASAVALGREGGAALEAAIASFPVAIERLSLKDLKGEELQEAISAAIGAQADTIAQTLVPGLDAFQVIGQGYFETLVRVASGIEVANYQLELLGVTAVDYTSIIRKQGDVAAEIVRQSIVSAETAGGVLSNVGQIINTLSGDSEELAETYTQLVDVRGALIKVGESGESLTTAMIRGAGGLDNLADSLDTFFSEFFSEGEQFSANAGALAGEFARLGLAMPGTRDEFRALIDVLGKDASEAGQKLFAKVLGLAGAFDEVADAAEEAAERLTDAIVSGLERFGTPQERRDASFGAISTTLQRDAGVSISIEQLIGASITDIDAFARSFLVLGGATDEAKIAVINAAVALAELKDEAAAQGRSLELDLMRAQGREYEAIAIERQAEIEQLSNLEGSLGVVAGTFTKLQEELYAAADAAKILSGLDNVISDFLSGEDLAKFRAQRIQTTLSGAGINVSLEQIMGATTEEIVALWGEVGDAGKQAILDSYGQLNTLQSELTKDQRKGLEDQLAGMKGLRDMAKDLRKFVSELKFGDLSPLSAEAQLAEADKLFETTLARARGGDTKAQGELQGVAQAFLQEAQGAFASGAGFTAIFDRVTGALESLGLEGEALDPQIKVLEDIFTNDRKMLDALLSIDSTLKGAPTLLDLGGIGERDFVTGPAGSSGGLSGTKVSTFDNRGSEAAVIDFTPIVVGQQSVIANTAKQTELMERMLVKLDEVAAATNANASIDQKALSEVRTELVTLNSKFGSISRDQQMSNSKQRAFPTTA